MTSLRDVVEAISTRASTIGLRDASVVPEKVNPPAAFVAIGEMDRTAFRLGSMSIPFDLVVLTSIAGGRPGQQALLDYANPDANDDKSVWAAFETSLGLTNVDVKLLTYRPLGIEEVGGTPYFSAAFGGTILFTAGS